MKSQPKVLLYGTNCASVINSLVIGFEKINIPIKALSFDFKRSVYNNYSKIECICQDNKPGKTKQFFYKIKGALLLIRYLLWCDVIHIYGTKNRFHYWIIAKLAKHKFISFLGSDVRVPEVELATNPYYKFAYFNPDYDRKRELKNKTDDLVKYLAQLGYGFIVWDTITFINQKFTNKIAIVPHASINNIKNDYTAKSKADNKVLIIHSPTNPVAKGTEFVLKAIDKLKKKGIEFEFKLLKDIPNDTYQSLLMEADIYVDQFIWGGYGVAAQQAMEMGKVVVTYMTEERTKLYGETHPIQMATIDNLADVLENLIANKELRKQISDQSVSYYQKVHKPERVALKVLSTYKLLESK